MSSPLPHQIESLLKPFYGDDERLGVLLSYCVGRLMLRSAKTGEDWERLARGEDIRHITDWLKASVANDEAWLNNVDDRGRPKKLMKFSSIEDITKEANKAMMKAAQRLSSVKLVEGDEEFYGQLQDGFSLVRLLTPAALDRESAQMQHCIGNGGYDRALAKRGILYLSLRDSHGKAHATLEVNGGKLVQLQGKQNSVPTDKYLEALIPFLKSTGWQIDIPTRILGHVIDINGDWYKIDSLPNGLTVDGNLDLENTKITHLPEGLYVGGNLYLGKSKITHLPEVLTVGGGLSLYSTSIAYLPDGLVVGGNINLRDTNISHLPEDFTVNGYLDLRGTNIAHLPERLTVGGYLDLQGTNITELPRGLTVIGSLNLQGTKITHLPEGLTVGGLNLRKTNITQLPAGLVVSGNLDLENTNIIHLPEDLTVKFSIGINNTKITKLPDSLSPETLVYIGGGIMTVEEFRNLGVQRPKMLG